MTASGEAHTYAISASCHVNPVGEGMCLVTQLWKQLPAIRPVTVRRVARAIDRSIGGRDRPNGGDLFVAAPVNPQLMH